MTSAALHRAAIVGVSNTRQARELTGEDSISITFKAVMGALADAGLTVADVDGVSIRSGMIDAPGSRNARAWGWLLGGRPAWTGGTEAGVRSVLDAATAIAAGFCSTVVVASGQAGSYSEREKTAPWTRPANEFTECWGLYTAAEFALIARRHMHLYGTTPEHLAEVSATIRNHGHVNPEAVYHGRGPFTPEDILNSRMVADPFHVLDCSMTSEGASAIVVTTVERARDLPGRPVYLLGGALDRRGEAYVVPPVWDDAGDAGRWAAEKAFAMAGLGPADIDVCEFYDPFSFEIIRQFEAFGFCGLGEGGPFVMDGRIGLGGQFPVCTDGGTMSFSHPGSAQLLQKVISGVRQIRGTAGPVQVAGAKTVMATNGGAGALFTDVVILGAEPR